MKIVMVIIVAVMILGGILTLTACQTLDSPLYGYNWILYDWSHNGETKKVISGTEISLYFNDTDKNFSGSGGCNQYGGTYTLNGLDLTLSDIFMTEMSCGAEKDQQEQDYLKALKKVTNFVMDHGHLKMYCGTDIMQFKREGATTTSITKWGD